MTGPRRISARAGSAALTVLMTAAPAVSGAQTGRPMVTDRPTRTDSPYSVEVEHFQIEMDGLTYGHFKNDDIEIDDFSVAAMNLKYGFTEKVDVQFLITPYISIKTTTDGAEETDNGFGPVGMRFKINLAGNDGEGTAVAVLPYFLAPTRGMSKLDNTLYGVTVPVAFPLAGGRSIGAAAGAQGVGNKDTFGFASAVFSTPIAYGWSGFLELYGIANGFKDADSQVVTLNAGAVLVPGPNWSLDAGVYYGITSDAENWRVFMGASALR
jgi:hypothetical protein